MFQTHKARRSPPTVAWNSLILMFFDTLDFLILLRLLQAFHAIAFLFFMSCSVLFTHDSKYLKSWTFSS